MLQILFPLVLIAAVVAWWSKRWNRRRRAHAAATRAGTAPERAIPILNFGDMDEHLKVRWCGHCGGYLQKLGEGTREVDGRRYRVARLECQECERPDEVFFDTTDLLH